MSNAPYHQSVAKRSRPLEGVRVLDFTMILAGPYGTRLLADMGAEVIKVEPPAGDHTRSRRPVRNGASSVFAHLNSGKHSIVLDLKKPAARDAAIALAAKCDVVVENWRPGVSSRLGLDFEALSQVNPRLIYCSLSGFGQKGPGSGRPAYAPIVQAASGFDLAQMAYQGATRPPKTGTFIGDIMGGLTAFAAIQTALFRREQTGEGQYIDVSLMDCMLNLLVHECQEAQHPLDRTGRLYRPLKTRDGFIAVAPTSQRNFEQMAGALHRPEWLWDARFNTPSEREANWAQLMDLAEQWSSEHTSSECIAILQRQGVPCTRYQTIEEAMHDEQTEFRGSFSTVRDAGGEFRIPNAPFQMPGLDTGVRPEIAGLGQHTGQVLRDLLGLDEAEVHRINE